MGWFTIEDANTGRALSPLEPTPPCPLLLRAHGGLRLVRCEGASMREEHDASGVTHWRVVPNGPFALILTDTAFGEATVHFDDATAVAEAPPDPEPPTPVEPLEPPVTPPASTPVAPPPETSVAPPTWRPRALALQMLTDAARVERLEDLARRALACRASLDALMSAAGAPSTTEDEATDTVRRLVALFRERGQVPAWVGDVRAARAQRALLEATLARARAEGAPTNSAAEGEAGDPRALVEELVARGAERQVAWPEDPDAALAAVVDEMESVADELAPLTRAVRAVASDASHRRDVRSALIARAELRALGHRS